MTATQRPSSARGREPAEQSPRAPPRRAGCRPAGWPGRRPAGPAAPARGHAEVRQPDPAAVLDGGQRRRRRATVSVGHRGDEPHPGARRQQRRLARATASQSDDVGAADAAASPRATPSGRPPTRCRPAPTDPAGTRDRGESSRGTARSLGQPGRGRRTRARTRRTPRRTRPRRAPRPPRPRSIPQRSATNAEVRRRRRSPGPRPGQLGRGARRGSQPASSVAQRAGVGDAVEEHGRRGRHDLVGGDVLLARPGGERPRGRRRRRPRRAGRGGRPVGSARRQSGLFTPVTVEVVTRVRAVSMGRDATASK